MVLMALRLPSTARPLMTISWFVGFWTRTVVLQELPFWRYVSDSDTTRSSGTSVSMVGSNTTGIHSGTGPALTLQVTGIVLPWGITTFCLLSLTVPKSSGVFHFFPTKLMRAVTKRIFQCVNKISVRKTVFIIILLDQLFYDIVTNYWSLKFLIYYLDWNRKFPNR